MDINAIRGSPFSQSLELDYFLLFNSFIYSEYDMIHVFLFLAQVAPIYNSTYNTEWPLQK